MKTNKRRSQAKKKKAPQRLEALRAFFATSLILSLACIGLWRCLDDDASPSVASRKTPRNVRVTSVDVGEGKTADPTLVNEKSLLEEEMPEAKLAPPPEEETRDAPDVAEEIDAQAATVFPKHGVAFHFHTQMMSEPGPDARAIAYARRGATFRLGERLSTKGCAKGWHEVAPGGLFVCAGQGVLVGDEPMSFAPSPRSPDLDAPMPYDYAYVTRDHTPEYWRVPSTEEGNLVESLFSRMAREAAAEAVSGAEPVSSGQSPVQADSSPRGPQELGEGAIAETTGSGASLGDGVEPLPSANVGDAGVGLPAAAMTLPSFVYLRMAKGYYVSTDDEVEENGVRYQRTIRGRFIPANRLAPATPSDFEGILLGRVNALPTVFVVGGGVSLLRRERPEGPFKNFEKVARLSRLDYRGITAVGNRRYIQVGDDLFLSSRVSSMVEASSPPSDIGDGERWIDIDLSEQTLVAYEGHRPVFATLVSTGREGFETPTGSFRIYSKHVTITMDDPEAGEEAYSIEDVPWVQYFKDSYARHAAFWHNRFGRVRSHGCVNLSPRDARRLFFWTGPHLPDGVHGASSTKDNLGTRVVIHD